MNTRFSFHAPVQGIIACWILLFVTLSLGQLRPITIQRPFKWNIAVKETAKNTGTITAKLSIAKGHYVYKDKTRIEPVPAKGLKFGKPVFSAPARKKDKFTAQTESVYTDSLIITIPVRTESAGSQVRFIAHYQGCSESMCFLPVSDTLSATIAVAQTEKERPTPAANQTGRFSLLAAFLGGLLTCFTPCVYPLIPITLAIFGASSAKSRAHAFSLSFVYVLGLAVMFSALGFAAAKTGSVFGQALSTPWVVGGIAMIFVAFALSMFGLFDIQLPASLQEKLVSTGGKGYRKSFVMGAVSGVIAAPCTGPALGAILAYAAIASTPWAGFSMLLLYALGLGLPFLVLGTFSGLLTARPKPGPWMEGVKSVLGIALVITALYLARPLFQEQLGKFAELRFFPAIMGILAIAGVGMGAVHLSFHAAARSRALRKAAGIALVVTGLFGILHGRLWDAPSPSSQTSAAGAQWVGTVEQELARARADSRPVMIDYSAQWCAACKELDRHTFPDPAVAKELARFVVIRADMTKSNSQASEWAKRQGVTGLPTLDFYDSNGERVMAKRVMGFMDAQSFLAHIREIK